MMLNMCKRIMPYKEIGWHDVGETFYRFTLVKMRWGNAYLHCLDAPNLHDHCHDHPWTFITILLSGYWEDSGHGFVWHRRGSILYRPATYHHRVVTKGPSWSLIVTTRKFRNWGFVDTCGAKRI